METNNTNNLTEPFDNIDIVSRDDQNGIFESSNTVQEEETLSPVLEEITTDDNGDKYIEITVSDPQKVGDGIGSFLAYKVSTKTNIPKFKKKQFNTLRRFSDFLGLYEILAGKYLRKGRIIPPAPEKNLIGSTKVKMSQQQVEPGIGLNLEWIENRRASLERYLNRTAQHPVLRCDVDFINFLESDEELPRAVNTAALSGASVMRLFNKVGETVNKITYKMDENDSWFNEKIMDIDNLDSHFQKLHSALKALVHNRRELASATGAVAKSAAMLSTCEEHTGLSRALSQLADIEEKIEILRSEQANSDLYILSETVKDYIGLFGAINSVFHERVKVFQNWQHAQLQLTKRREFKAKMEISGKTVKQDQLQKEVEEWEAKVQRCQDEFDDISAEIKKEIEHFEITKTKDIKKTMIKYLEDQMAHQQQIAKFWEVFIPFAKEIA